MKLTIDARAAAIFYEYERLKAAGFETNAAARYAAELVERPGADILVAPGLVLHRSVCTCTADCDPFTAEARAAVTGQ